MNVNLPSPTETSNPLTLISHKSYVKQTDCDSATLLTSTSTDISCNINPSINDQTEFSKLIKHNALLQKENQDLRKVVAGQPSLHQNPPIPSEINFQQIVAAVIETLRAPPDD